MKTHAIKDGQTIHLVIRNKPTNSDNLNPASTNSSRNSNQNISSTSPSNDSINTNLNNNNISSSNNNNTNARPSFPTANPMMGNLGEVQQRLQQMLISNPETMQSMITPLMQQMMSNPNTIRSLFGSMQRMHSLMERNPEVNHLLSNPDVLRESLEMVRNPAALQEVMRNYDRALNNMESMPGGYNVLRRMYTEFQEPLLSAFHENANQFSPQQGTGESPGNPSGNGSDTEQQRTENRDPLPNPWAQPTQTTTNNSGSRPQIPAGLFGGVNDGLEGANLGGLGGLGASLESALGGLGGLAGLGGLGGLGSDFGAGVGGLGAPNPDGNSNANDLLQRAGALFQDQEFMSLLTHPEALQSVMQIQQGMERLRRIAPGLFDRFQTLGMSTNNNNNNNNNNNSSSNNNNNNNSGAGPDSAEGSDQAKDKSKQPEDKPDGHA